MRLTKHHKEAFVNAVMQDVPMVDYDEQAEKLITDEARNDMPQPVRDVFDNKDLRKYLQYSYHSTLGYLRSVHVYQHEGWQVNEQATAKLRKLSELKNEQNHKRRQLKEKLSGVINSCTTLKQAQDLLPKFIKYLPAESETAGTKNLPAITGLVTDLTELGWPKEATK